MISPPTKTVTQARPSKLRQRKAPAALRRVVGESGFTLLELMVVVAIIAILAGLTLFALGGVQKKASRDRAKSEISAISNSLENYRAQHGDYPDAAGTGIPYDGVDGLKPYMESYSGQIRGSTVVDPFGNPYVYIKPGKTNPASFDLYSTGGESDDKDGSPKRIGNW